MSAKRSFTFQDFKIPLLPLLTHSALLLLHMCKIAGSSLQGKFMFSHENYELLTGILWHVEVVLTSVSRHLIIIVAALHVQDYRLLVAQKIHVFSWANTYNWNSFRLCWHQFYVIWESSLLPHMCNIAGSSLQGKFFERSDSLLIATAVHLPFKFKAN